MGGHNSIHNTLYLGLESEEGEGTQQDIPLDDSEGVIKRVSFSVPSRF